MPFLLWMFPVSSSKLQRDFVSAKSFLFFLFPGFWVHCNDSKLNVCSVEEVCKTQAYILFYTQRTLQDKAGIPEKQLQTQVFATQNQ